MPVGRADHRRAAPQRVRAAAVRRRRQPRRRAAGRRRGVWQVLLALYILSALLAAIAGILVAGLVKTASLALVEQSVLPSVAAAVIGGTSIMGGRGGYAGTIVGALILTVLTSLLPPCRCPRPSARSCSAPSSSSSPPPTRGSSTCRDVRRHAPRDRSRRHEPQMGGRRARTATTGSSIDRGQVADRSPARARTPSSGALGEIGRTALERLARDRLARDRRARPLRPGDRLQPVPGQHAGRLVGPAGGGAGRSGARHPGRADQRRARVRPGRASAGRRARRRARSSG